MFDDRHGFLTRGFLQREWAGDYLDWTDEQDAALLKRLRDWSARGDLRERSAQGPFVQTFFVDTWGYEQAGRGGEMTAQAEYAIPGAGAGGAAGSADLALGWLAEPAIAVPQVLCEFKDIRSDLDAPQPRKGNTRSPVKQCLDYMAGARRGLFGTEPVLPWWGVVSDMNEFRLYWWDRAPQSYLRFVIQSPTPLTEPSLTDEGPQARFNNVDPRFDRFVFARLFARDRLLSRGGRPPLLRLVERQGGREKELEGEFYQDYRAVRERLFSVLMANNQAYRDTPARLLRLAQRILDRFIFAFYCEDMGARILFPPQLLRDTLTQRSTDPFYDPNGDEIWRQFKGLFRAMDAGGRAGQIDVRAFNGGLFRQDDEIDALALPNHVFAEAGQGANPPASIQRHRDTLLHLSASYDYASRGAARESVSLYTLGRIFEQSITELEKREAELMDRPSLTVLAKRKLPTRRAQGVYYTPEWVVERVVEGALGAWLADRKADCGWPGDSPETLDQLEAYAARVAAVRVVDPACGSGAFLIGAFRRLLREREEIEGFRRVLDPAAPRAGEAALTADILDRNIYGVDISGSAVEIAKLALWLHSARADAPLSSLDGAVKCGNSLVGPDYYDWTQIDAFSEAAKDQVNAFDWAERFAFDGDDPGRFDVVVGNPPYVKLQNLRAVGPDVTDYLAAPRAGGYRSTQTGNWDLYLPFIEKGLRLLRPGGRMGYIAPSLWAVNEYGEALRKLVHERQALTRWIDFRSHQIFDEAITYTALQFFAADGADAVQVAPAPRGELDVADIDWADGDLALGWDRLPEDNRAWLLATGEDRALIDRLSETCLRLDDPSLTTNIFQGLITSADSIYHLTKLAAGRYRCTPKDGDPKHGRPHTPPYEVDLEDAIMRPLVSGAEAKRYEEPVTDTWLLFPYERDANGRMGLISAESMADRFPQAWNYLGSYEGALRGRENAAFDESDWYRLGRNQSIDKQDQTKLVVAQTVPAMRVCADTRADKYLNNVRVNGILSPGNASLFYVLGVLNGTVADFVFKRLGKPKQGGWYEANKQFIAPLPIPKATEDEQIEVGRRARELQTLHTSRRDLDAAIQARLGAIGKARHDERWLWPDLPTLEDLQDAAPARRRRAPDRREWAETAFAERLDLKHADLQSLLDRPGRLQVAFADGAVTLGLIGAPPALTRYLDDAHGPLVAAWWKWLLRVGKPTDAKAFAADLRRPPADPLDPAAPQFIQRLDELLGVIADIDAREGEMNALLYDLYGLTDDERRLVERG